MDAIRSFLGNTNIQELVFGWGLKIVIALLIFFVGRWIARWVTRSLRKVLEIREMDVTLVNFLANLVYAVLLTAVVIAALQSLGLPVTSLVAVLGAAGLAIGLALKDSLGNLAAGVMLVMFRPFTRGDFVEVAGTSGKVDEVRIFSTILTTPDNKQVIIPNGQVAADTITNYTALDTRRVDLVIGVGYDDDLKLARSVLERICSDHPSVLDDPATKVFVANLGDSSVDFNVRPWCKTDDYWDVYSDLLESAKVELEAAGCSIPYPQTDVHLHKVKKQGD
jgi:small conductance mechanosensitive channel